MYNRIIINYPDGMSDEFKKQSSKLEIFINRDGSVDKIETTNFGRPCFKNIKCCSSEWGCEFCRPEESDKSSFEDGDIIVLRNHMYGIFDGTRTIKGGILPFYISLLTFESQDPILSSGDIICASPTARKANAKEKELFEINLSKAGYRWDYEEKTLVRLLPV